MVSRSLPCHVRGGLERHVADLVMGLAREGIEMHLLCAEADDATRRDFNSAGIELHELRGVRSDRYSLAYMRRVGGEIRRLHAQHSFDVIHAQEFALGFDSLEDLIPAAPLVLSVHGTITSETPLHPDVWPTLSLAQKIRALARFGRRYLYAASWRRALKSARTILVDSDFTSRELKTMDALLADKIRVIPLATNFGTMDDRPREISRTTLGWPLDEIILITLGRLEWQKGHALAIESLSKLNPVIPWRYLIIGEGPERTALEELAAKLNLAGRIKFMGRVDEPTRAATLAAADLFLWPERTHPAFGLVGLESLAMGTPVLASRRGAISEIVDAESGWVVNDADWTPTLTRILEHREWEKFPPNTLRTRTLNRFPGEAMAREVHHAYLAVANMK